MAKTRILAEVISKFSLLTLYQKSRLLTLLEKKALENIVGKGENAGNQHFLLFPQWFLLFPAQISIFESELLHHRQMFTIWTCLKFCRVVNHRQMFSIWTCLKFCCVVKSSPFISLPCFTIKPLTLYQQQLFGLIHIESI